MTLLKDSAIVLRRLDYSETSQVLVVFTRGHGQQRLIAKGVKRSTKTRTAVGIDLLEHGSLVYSRRAGKEGNLATLTQWHQENIFPHLRRDLRRSYAAQYAAEVTAQLTETHDSHPAIFDGLHHLLLALEQEDPLLALIAYLWLLLREIGLRPDLTRCVNCGRPTPEKGVLYFSSRQGGAICRDCEPAIVEKRRISQAIAQALASTDRRPDRSLATAVFDLLDYHFTELMSRPPKVSAVLRSVLTQ